MLDKIFSQHSELFPSEFIHGYTLHDILPESKKLKGMRLRRIKLKSNSQVYTIVPGFLLPYMTGYTDDVEHALFLRRYGVPYSALTHIWGHNDMNWYRIENSIGKNSIVGTTIKDPNKIPVDIIADEKHSRENKEKIYIATTIADNCVLGMSVAPSASTEDLTEAYGHFKTEAQNVNPDYQPETVNTDGWAATKAAWQKLFSKVVIIICFLHAFIKIRNCCKHLKSQFHEICDKVWDIYHSIDKLNFMDQVNELKSWAKDSIESEVSLQSILKLCDKANQFVKTYEHPKAYRTSNMLDRIMDQQDRFIYSCKYFHGHRMSSEYSVRSWALLYNFSPYCDRSKISKKFKSPAHYINGFVYHDNWLQNLLISASMRGFRQ